MALAGLLLAALGARIAIDVVRSHGQFGTARAGTAQPALPQLLAVPGPKPRGVGSQPAGPAIAAYISDDDNREWWVFVGARRSSYRRLEIGDYGADQAESVASALLAPDGRRVARTSVGSESRRISIVSLTSGASRAVPDLQLARDDALLAWSPDSTRLALRLGGKLAVIDVDSGNRTRFDLGVRAAAFSPDGALVAASADDRLSVVSAGGSTGAGGTGAGSRFIGDHEIAKAGWSPDGTTIALQSSSGLATYDVASRRVTAGAGDSSKLTALAWRDAHAVVAASGGGTFTSLGATGTKHPDALDSYDFRTGERLTLTRSADPRTSMRGPQLASSLVPEMTLVPAGRIDRGAPRLWYGALLLSVLAMAAVGRWWPRPRSSRPETEGARAARELLVHVVGLSAVVVLPMLPLMLLLRLDLVPRFFSVLLLGIASMLLARSLPRSESAASPAAAEPVPVSV